MFVRRVFDFGFFVFGVVFRSFFVWDGLEIRRSIYSLVSRIWKGCEGDVGRIF